MAVKKAYSYHDIDKIKFIEIQISEDWKQHFGEPQLGNSHWLIYGESGHGKTNYALQIAKQLCSHHKIHYNTKEEGLKKSFLLSLKRNNMKGVKNFNYHSEDMEELKNRLDRPRQAKIVIIDSVQYFFRGKRSKDYFDFIAQFENTTFIWISGANGKMPKGKVAEDIYYDADIVVNVKDFIATVLKNRFDAYAPRIIWEHGANERQIKLLNKG